MKQVLAILVTMVFSLALYAGENTKTVKISTSAQCGMCETTIEKAVNGLDGIENADLDMRTKAVTVSYNADKVSADDIREAISAAGYDADEVKADKSAYKKLPNCCKKPVKSSGGGC